MRVWVRVWVRVHVGAGMGMGEARVGLERRPSTAAVAAAAAAVAGAAYTSTHEYERRTHRSVCAHGACEGRAPNARGGLETRLGCGWQRRCGHYVHVHVYRVPCTLYPAPPRVPGLIRCAHVPCTLPPRVPGYTWTSSGWAAIWTYSLLTYLLTCLLTLTG